MKNVNFKVRVLALVLLLLGNTLSIAASAQNRLSLNLRNVPLSQFIGEIESKTDYTFFINDTRVDVKTPVSANENNATLEQVLRNVFASTNYTYEIVDKQILVRIKAVNASPEQSAKKTIRGVIVDENGDAAIGANILESGTSNGTITDINGAFTLDVDPANKIQVTMIGYVTQELAIGNRTNFEITMVEDTQLLDEVVIIGYGTIKKSDLTGAVSSVSAKDLQTNVAQSVSGALQGRVAGVTVGNSGGQPGAGMSINIRGLSSLGNNTPLYLIDGVYGDINMVDPADITSLEVLKDASAAAIYGSRAANGVVLITTKGGKKNSPIKIDINAYAGVQNVSKKLDVMDANQWISVISQNYEPDKLPETVKNWKGGKGTNWQDEGFRSAAIYKANVNLSGGGQNSTYNVSAGYLSQDGIMLNSGYESFTARTKNMFYLMNDHVRIGSTLLMKSWKQQKNTSVLSDYLRMNSLVPVYDENQLGGYGVRESWMKNMDNPIGASKLFDNNTNGTEIFLNAFLEVDLFVKGLKYKLNGGYQKSDSRNYNYNPEYNFGSGNIQSKIAESAGFDKQWLVENTLHYDNTFGKHTVSGLFGYSAQKNTYRGFGASRKDIPAGTSVIGAGSRNEQDTSGEAQENAIVSMFGRAMYSYDSRYMVSASIRRDGSSRFADGHRYGVFPSASVGWNVMNEEFFTNLRETVSEFKFRASYGVLGNQEIGNYATQNVVSKGINYLTQNPAKMWNGAITGNSWVSPENLTWEETKTVNFGLDGGLWNGKLTFSADYYVQTTDNILLEINMPISVGMTKKPTMNAGTIQNKGFEFSMNHRNNVGDFYYNVGVNLATVKNEVKKVTVGSIQEFSGWTGHEEGPVNWTKVGYPIGGFFLIKTDGIFQNEQEIKAHVDSNGNLLQPDAQPGDIRFLRGDNSLLGEITEQDAQYVGNPFPDLTYGIRLNAEWKGFDLNMFFDGTIGNDIYNYSRARLETTYETYNYSTAILNSWTPQNTNTDVPRYAFPDPNNNSRRVSDRWLEDGSYFRMKTLEFGYTLPKHILRKIHVDHLRIFTSMENLFTITSYSGYTPDLGQNSDNNGGGTGVYTRGVDYGRYPQARTFSLGLQLNF